MRTLKLIVIMTVKNLLKEMFARTVSLQFFAFYHDTNFRHPHPNHNDLHFKFNKLAGPSNYHNSQFQDKCWHSLKSIITHLY